MAIRQLSPDASISDEELLDQWGTTLVADIQANIRRHGQVVTGQTLESVHKETEASALTIFGAWHLGSLEYGRGPTKNPGDGALKRQILAWLLAKRIVPKGKQKLESLAYAIAKEIHEHGSKLFREHRQSGIITEVITQERIDSLRDVFSFKYQETVLSDILRNFKPATN